MNAVGDDLGATVGNIINCSYKLMAQIKPDAVLILGDTNSCLSAIPAKRLHIPIFHMEAGNRCKDECLPEETNRRIVDIISDVNMAYSEHARRYLAECGLPKERTYVTGSPMAEVLHANLPDIEKSDILSRLGLERGRYILLSAHREENIDTEKNFESLFGAINRMAEKYDMPVLYSCHPRSRKRLETSGFALDPRVIRHEPLGFHDYNNLQMNAFAVVSDSGTLPEESSFFTSVGKPFPAVCIRTSTERPEALDKGCFVLAGLAVISAGAPLIDMVITQLVINSRYSLMSLALSQKMGDRIGFFPRLFIAFHNTDEIFALAMEYDKPLTVPFLMGLGILPIAGWTSGTLLGAVAGTFLPQSVRTALGVALYGMFVAIVVPQAKKSHPLLAASLISVGLACAFRWVPYLKNVTEGIAVVICAVIASAVCAVLFPISEEAEKA